MKKSISLVLILSMLLTMFSLSVPVAAQTYLVNMTSATVPSGLVVSNANTYTLTAVDGYGGKADGDESALITGNAGSNNIYFGYTYKIMSADTASYLVLEYDVFPAENFKYFSFMTDKHAMFGGALYTTDSTETDKKCVLNRYQWNKVTLVVENTIKTSGATLVQGTGTGKADYVPGEEKTGIHKAYTYVNGKPVYPDENGNAIGQLCPYFGYRWHAGDRWANGNAVRAAMYPAGSNVTYTGAFDNVRYYETETAPVISEITLPTISDGAYYDVSGNTITVYDTTAQTTADIVVAEGCSVNAYTDSTNTVSLADGAKLAPGNTVTVTDGNYVNYYTVAEQSAKTIVKQASDMTGFNANSGRLGTFGSVTGASGKASDDVSLRIDAQPAADLKSRTGFIDYSWPQIAAGNLYTSGYLATEYNFCLPSESELFFDYIGLYTNQNSAYGVAVNENSITKDRWHKIFVAHDVVNKKAKMYLDGKLIKEDIPSVINSASGKNASRIFCGTANKADVIDSSVKAFFYVDDITTFYSAFEPIPGALPALTSTSGYSVFGTDIIPAGELKLADIAAPANGAIRAFRKGAALASDAELQIGDIVVIEDNTKAINTYNISDGKICHKASTNAGTTAYGNAVTVEKLYGYAGKEASDESMKIKNTYKTTTEDGVTTYGTDYNAWPNLGSLIWANRKNPDSRYVIIEANVLPDDGVMYVYCATNGHALISSNVSELNAGEWNKYVTVIDMTTFEAKTYINGKLANTRTSAFKGVSKADAIRFSLYMKNWYDASRGTTIPEQDPVYNTSRPVVDDMYVYESANYPIITAPVELANGVNGSFTKTGDVIQAVMGQTVADLKAAYATEYRTTVYDKDTYAVKTGDALLANGDVFAIDAGDQTYSYYDIETYGYNELIIDSMHYDAETNVLSGSNLSAYASVEDDAVIMVAQYGEDDVLQKVDYAYASDGVAEIDYKLSTDKAKYLKVFLWENLSSMAPLCKEKIINLPEYEAAIACWGDSLTFGQGADYNTETYPVVLSNLTGIKTYNLGVGGETATTIASRQGTYDIRLTQDVTIPESGTVEIKFAAYEDGIYAGVVTPRNEGYGAWNPCVINGVEGNLTINVNSSVWPRILNWAKFTRTTPGEAVACSVGEKVIPQAQTIKADINVFFTGTNNAWTPENKNGGEDPALLAELVRKQVEYANNNGKCVVIGLTSGNADKWVNENAALKNEFGDNFLDLKAYLVSEQALADAGITPTDTDLADIAKGHVPTSLVVSDGTHFNAKGYALIAQQLKNKMVELGYVAE